MPKYRPKVRWNNELECEVEDGVPTGVLDEHGNELFRYEKGPMGFRINA